MTENTIQNSEQNSSLKINSSLEGLSSDQLEAIIVDALEDVKAKEITVLDTSTMTRLFDRVIVATATSNTQTKALANRVYKNVKDAGGKVNSIEGLALGEWVLVDCIDVVVHIMLPPIRAYYRIEEIWSTNSSHVIKP
jgi:ribosome-associated protein